MARKLYLVHSRTANSHSAGFGLSFHLAVSSLLKLVKYITREKRQYKAIDNAWEKTSQVMG